MVESNKQTPEYAKSLITRTRIELANTALMQQVLDLIETIVLYKLPRLSRQELIKMFELDTFDIKKTRIYEELKEEILDEVKQEQTVEVVMRLLRRRIGNVDQQIQQRMSQLSVEQLENLAEALLDFATPADLSTWLQDNYNQL